MPRRFIPLTEVSEILDVSAAQAYALVRNGDLPAIKVGGRGQWRVETVELEAYIERMYAQTRDLVTTRSEGTTDDGRRLRRLSVEPVGRSARPEQLRPSAAVSGGTRPPRARTNGTVATARDVLTPPGDALDVLGEVEVVGPHRVDGPEQARARPASDTTTVARSRDSARRA